jgi:hypothetical protein
MAIYQSLKDRLKNQHDALGFMLENVKPVLLDRKPAPGKWSIRDQVAHLAKYQPVFLERLERIIKENEPRFERYRAEDDPEFCDWQKMELRELLTRLNADREILVKRILSLNERDLNRVGVHLKFGRLSVAGWTEFFVLHEAHHLFAIWQMKYEISDA